MGDPQWTRGDEEGEFTFTGGVGSTVIDYVIGNELTRERIRRMEVGDRIDSNHLPLEVWIEGERVSSGGKRKEGGKVWRGIWDREGREEFRGRMEEELKRDVKEGEEWERLEGLVREALKEIETERQGEGRKKLGWWDEECRERKKEVRKELRKWRGDGGKGEEEETRLQGVMRKEKERRE